MPCRWHKHSIFGDGPRVRLDREQRAQFRAKLHLQRRPGRLTIAAAQLGRVLVDMLGADGRLDPCLATLAVRAGIDLATVKRCLARLKLCGFLDWTRRLVRGSDTGWRAEQTSNAYVLRVPSCEAHFAPAVSLVRFKKATGAGKPVETDRESAARQILALGFPVPEAWHEGRLLTRAGSGQVPAT
jgi:hypothetical protein